MKYITLDDRLAEYIDRHRSRPDDTVYDEIRSLTRKFGEHAVMQVPDHQASFMTIITKLIGAKTALEIGTFTGASSVAIARGLPPGGKLTCLDHNIEWTNVARAIWKKYQIEDKIELHIGDAVGLLTQLPSTPLFDLVHVDADKRMYDTFFETALPLVRSGGLFVFDNMLRRGTVTDASNDPFVLAVQEMNQKLANDPRVEAVLLEVGDGLQFCRKV